VETILDGLFAEAVSVVESERTGWCGTTWERIKRFRHDVTSSRSAASEGCRHLQLYRG
jgi:hypothetical protein